MCSSGTKREALGAFLDSRGMEKMETLVFVRDDIVFANGDLSMPPPSVRMRKSFHD